MPVRKRIEHHEVIARPTEGEPFPGKIVEAGPNLVHYLTHPAKAEALDKLGERAKAGAYVERHLR